MITGSMYLRYARAYKFFYFSNCSRECALSMSHEHIRCLCCGEQYSLNCRTFQEITAQRIKRHVEFHQVES
jgi:hypothetical protein